MLTLKKEISGRNILFVSTKNRDYIRNQQEIKLLKDRAKSYEEIAFTDKSYIKRIFKVYLGNFKIKKKWKMVDIIFVGFAPQLLLPFLRIWWKEKKVIIDFFISLYDTFVHDRKLFKDGSLCAKLLHKVDEWTLFYCHHIIADTLEHAQYFSREFGIPFDKIEVMYLEADTDIFNAAKYRVVKNKDKLLVLYFGSILPLQGVEVILEAANLLKAHTDIAFVIVGPVKTEHKIPGNEYPNIEFQDWLPQEELAERIAEADLCIAGHFNAKIEKARRTIPGKAYIYEAMGKPMILGDNRANHELFPEDERHFYVEMGNAKALADKIAELRDKWRGTGNGKAGTL